MTELTTRKSKQDLPQPALHRDILNLLAWAIQLSISAIHSLGMYALKQGGRVEFQFGPLTYRIYGNDKKNQ